MFLKLLFGWYKLFALIIVKLARCFYQLIQWRVDESNSPASLMQINYLAAILIIVRAGRCRGFEVSAAATNQNSHLDVGSDSMRMNMLETIVWSEFGAS